MKRSKDYLLRICKEFFNIDNIIDIKELTGGHINETYEVDFKEVRYVLQQLNSYVFYFPQAVMNNTKLILDHIKKKTIYEGENPDNILTLIKTKYDQYFAIIDEEYWRVTKFIENGVSYEQITSPNHFYECGRGIGKFQNSLSNFHSKMLYDPIKHFHDTPYRYEKFKEVVKLDQFDRVKDCKAEINQINSYSKSFDIIQNALDNKEIPIRVVHNDTKSTNILLNKNTGKFLAIIDLDTVMEGSVLYDYGDALRFGASTALEDETDLNKVQIDFDLFYSFTKGFLSEFREITQKEVNLLYDGWYIITLELAMRFLMDYIDGDHYFKIDKLRPAHNLERARNQLKLAVEIEKNKSNIESIINQILIELNYDKSYLINR